MTPFFEPMCGEYALRTHVGDATHRGEARHTLCCDCDWCLGYSCAPDQDARAAVEMYVAPLERADRRARMRRWLARGGEPQLDELRAAGVSLEWVPIEALSDEQLDALERRSA